MEAYLAFILGKGFRDFEIAWWRNSLVLWSETEASSPSSYLYLYPSEDHKKHVVIDLEIRIDRRLTSKLSLGE